MQHTDRSILFPAALPDCHEGGRRKRTTGPAVRRAIFLTMTGWDLDSLAGRGEAAISGSRAERDSSGILIPPGGLVARGRQSPDLGVGIPGYRISEERRSIASIMLPAVVIGRPTTMNSGSIRNASLMVAIRI